MRRLLKNSTAWLGASLLLAIAGVPQGVLATGDDGTLISFHAGAPNDPAWSALALDVAHDGAKPWVHFHWENVRCPMAWGVMFYNGTLPNVTPWASWWIDFAQGEQGVLVHSSSDGGVEVSTMENDGAKKCSMTNISLGFPTLPPGRMYFVQYWSGVPFQGRADLEIVNGGVTIVGESSGDRAFYVNSSGFSAGSQHVFVNSPGFTWPSSHPQNGLWTDNYWPGGEVASIDASFEREARVSFLHHPTYTVGTNVDFNVRNMSVTDPWGLVEYAQGATNTGGYALDAGNIWTRHGLLEYPPGEYVFRVNASIDAGMHGAAWHASGADFVFPGEET